MRFKVGKVYEIVGRNGNIRHHFNIGDVVKLKGISANGEGHYYRRKDGLEQFVSDCDVRKYHSIIDRIRKIFSKKRKGE